MHHFTSSLFWPQALPSLRGVSDVIPLAFPFKETRLDIDIEIKNESSDRYERKTGRQICRDRDVHIYTRIQNARETAGRRSKPKEVHGCVSERFFLCAKLCYGM